MILGKVTGTVVSTHKDENLNGLKLLVIQNVGLEMRLSDQFVVAADAIGAGMGEVVIVVQGSSARMATQVKGRPVDAAVVAIVDTVEVLGSITYQKEH